MDWYIYRRYLLFWLQKSSRHSNNLKRIKGHQYLKAAMINAISCHLVRLWSNLSTWNWPNIYWIAVNSIFTLSGQLYCLNKLNICNSEMGLTNATLFFLGIYLKLYHQFQNDRRLWNCDLRFDKFWWYEGLNVYSFSSFIHRGKQIYTKVLA